MYYDSNPLCAHAAMDSLSQLPLDILASILANHLHSHLVVALWKCGNSLLNHKLANSIDFMDLEDKRLDSTSRYPHFLSNLKKLRHLSLSRGNYKLCNDIVSELALIEGSKLETLIITGKQKSSHSFLMFPFEAPYNPPIAESTPLESHSMDFTEASPHPSSLTTTPPSASKLLDLSRYFPNLRFLNINLSDFMLPVLPPSLTKLWIEPSPRLRLQTNARIFFSSYLPKTIQELNCVELINPDRQLFSSDGARTYSSIVSFLHQEVFINAPPNLHTIANLILPEVEDLSFLPRSLTNTDFCFIPHSVPLNVSRISTLPTDFSKLELAYIDSEEFLKIGAAAWTSKLPSKLQTLMLASRQLCDLFSVEMLLNLPSSLTSLQILFRTPFENAHLKQATQKSIESKRTLWPPSLKDLYLSDFVMDYEDVKRLPPTLTRLECRYMGDIFPLHSGLVHAHIYSKSALSFDLTSETTSSLETLSVESLKDPSQLPPSVRLLFLTGLPEGSIRETYALTLPSGLTRLSIYGGTRLWFPLLPRTLLDLALYGMEDEWQDVDYKHVDLFATLPSGLKYLKLYWKETSLIEGLSADSFATLRSLKVLDAYGTGSFEPGVLKNLTMLENLNINLTSLDEDSASYINPYMEELSIAIENDADGMACDLLAKYWPLDVSTFHPRILRNLNPRLQTARDRSLLCPDPRVVISDGTRK